MAQIPSFPLRVAPALHLCTACSGTLNSHTLKEIVENEEAEGFLTYRVADRRGDHLDHRGHRNSEPTSVAYGGQRSFRGWFDPYDQHPAVTYSSTYPQDGFPASL